MGLRHLFSVAALIIVGLLVTGCVAPQYTYVTDSADSAYFKVPPSWGQVNQSTLQNAEGQASQEGTYLWSRAYDDTAKPSINNVFSSSDHPVAYASVLGLSAAERSDVSFNSMRDLLLPVTRRRARPRPTTTRSCPVSRRWPIRSSPTAITTGASARSSTTTWVPRSRRST